MRSEQSDQRGEVLINIVIDSICLVEFLQVEEQPIEQHAGFLHHGLDSLRSWLAMTDGIEIGFDLYLGLDLATAFLMELVHY